jgi:hypothetical protein
LAALGSCSSAIFILAAARRLRRDEEDAAGLSTGWGTSRREPRLASAKRWCRGRRTASPPGRHAARRPLSPIPMPLRRRRRHGGGGVDGDGDGTATGRRHFADNCYWEGSPRDQCSRYLLVLTVTVITLTVSSSPRSSLFERAEFELEKLSSLQEASEEAEERITSPSWSASSASDKHAPGPPVCRLAALGRCSRGIVVAPAAAHLRRPPYEDAAAASSPGGARSRASAGAVAKKNSEPAAAHEAPPS